MTNTCPSCGPVEPLYSWRPMQNGRRHVKAVCPKCGVFLGWAEQTPDVVAKADAALLTRPQQKGLFG